jgi:hypothetical protein
MWIKIRTESFCLKGNLGWYKIHPKNTEIFTYCTRQRKKTKCQGREMIRKERKEAQI